MTKPEYKVINMGFIDNTDLIDDFARSPKDLRRIVPDPEGKESYIFCTGSMETIKIKNNLLKVIPILGYCKNSFSDARMAIDFILGGILINVSWVLGLCLLTIPEAEREPTMKLFTVSAIITGIGLLDALAIFYHEHLIKKISNMEKTPIDTKFPVGKSYGMDVYRSLEYEDFINYVNPSDIRTLYQMNVALGKLDKKILEGTFFLKKIPENDYSLKNSIEDNISRLRDAWKQINLQKESFNRVLFTEVKEKKEEDIREEVFDMMDDLNDSLYAKDLSFTQDVDSVLYNIN